MAAEGWVAWGFALCCTADLSLRSSMAAMVQFEANLQQLSLAFQVLDRRLDLPALFAACYQLTKSSCTGSTELC